MKISAEIKALIFDYLRETVISLRAQEEFLARRAITNHNAASRRRRRNHVAETKTDMTKRSNSLDAVVDRLSNAGRNASSAEAVLQTGQSARPPAQSGQESIAMQDANRLRDQIKQLGGK
jgi:hypothetical protein